jgi:hypothetical protein
MTARYEWLPCSDGMGGEGKGEKGDFYGLHCTLTTEATAK